MSEPLSSPVAPNASQPSPPTVGSFAENGGSQIARITTSSTLPDGKTKLIEGSRAVADVWDWDTFTAREWGMLTEGRWDELRDDELVIAEHWTLGRTQLAIRTESAAEGGSRSAFAEMPPSESSQSGGQQ